MIAMTDKYFNRTLAFAGMLQAVSLVQQLAQTGHVDPASFDSTIKSIYKIDAEDVPAVYNGIDGLQLGLMELIKLFSDTQKPSRQSISYYLINIMRLERKLKKNKSIFTQLTKRIKHAVSQAEYFSPTHPQVIASLATIYTDTLGSFNTRIKVTGKAVFLTKTEVADKVRALLLAGIRSAVLWQQVGGARWQLFTARKTMVNTAKALLNM